MDRNKRKRRHLNIRKSIVGIQDRPRLSVFRSNQHIYAQIIDDGSGKTLVFESDIKILKGTKKDRAFEVGKKLAQQAVKKDINSVVFDRGGFLFQGRIAELAKGAREGGLNF